MTENDYIHVKEVQTLLKQEQGEETSLKEILLRFLYNWKWFVAGTFIMLVLAFLYLRYTPPHLPGHLEHHPQGGQKSTDDASHHQGVGGNTVGSAGGGQQPG
ncbi:MAG: hypothetical protein QM305_04790 [Bacteroidota bacterium]|nr:hypothetical protein [Bacteroidota bacterium]